MMCGSPHTTRRGHSFYKKKFKKKVFIKGQRQGMSIEGTVIGEREPTEGSLSYSTDELKNRYYTLDPNEIVSVSPGRTLSVPRDATSSQCCRWGGGRVENMDKIIVLSTRVSYVDLYR
jgi:hypothetical protein